MAGPPESRDPEQELAGHDRTGGRHLDPLRPSSIIFGDTLRDGGHVDVWHERFPGDWIQGTARMKMHQRVNLGDVTHETEDERFWRMDAPRNQLGLAYLTFACEPPGAQCVQVST